MSEPPPNAPSAKSERRKLIEAIGASTIGTTIEWYDFFLYGTAAALVFPKLFFPSFDPFAGQLLAFSTFTVGFLFRPLGGVIFGRIGDRGGRKAALVATLMLMGISTALIGLLPTYDRIGVAAPVILVLLRSLQGIGVGGEWGGAVLLALESGHRGKRGFYASWPQAGVPLGLLLSTGVVWLFRTLLSEDAFLDWGWRIPFLLSVALIAIGMWVRMWIGETPLFTQLKEQKRVAETPIREVVGRHWPKILLAAGSRFSENSCFYVFVVSIIAFNKTTLQVSESLVLGAVNVGAAGAFLSIPLFGVLSDFWSRKGMFVAGNLLLIAFAFPYYWLLETRTATGVLLATFVSLAVIHSLLYSVQASFIPELFSTRLRYSGASISYQLAGPFAGGTAPLITTWLVEVGGGASWPLAAYLVVIACGSIACVLWLSETSRKDISD